MRPDLGELELAAVRLREMLRRRRRVVVDRGQRRLIRRSAVAASAQRAGALTFMLMQDPVCRPARKSPGSRSPRPRRLGSTPPPARQPSAGIRCIGLEFWIGAAPAPGPSAGIDRLSRSDSARVATRPGREEGAEMNEDVRPAEQKAASGRLPPGRHRAGPLPDVPAPAALAPRSVTSIGLGPGAEVKVGDQRLVERP